MSNELAAPLWSTSQKRFFSFLEIENKLCKMSFEWLSKNIPGFEATKQMFAENDGFEQAHAMHDGLVEYDKNYSAFYNIHKLSANPLIIENKDIYDLDDIYIICLKLGYDVKEGVIYCTENEDLKQSLIELFKKVS